jgi:hypothetical protein
MREIYNALEILIYLYILNAVYLDNGDYPWLPERRHHGKSAERSALRSDARRRASARRDARDAKD